MMNIITIILMMNMITIIMMNKLFICSSAKTNSAYNYNIINKLEIIDRKTRVGQVCSDI